MGKFNIGSTVYTRDGEEAGEVDRVILDPRTGEVTHLALRSTGLLMRDIVVPVALVARHGESGVWLDASALSLEAMPAYSEGNFVSPSRGEMAMAPYRHGEVLVPVARVERGAAYQTELQSGRQVECRDGICGVVDQVLVDPVTGRALSFVLKRAGALTRDVLVPVEWVLETKPRAVVLDCSVAQLEEELQPIERVA